MATIIRLCRLKGSAPRHKLYVVCLVRLIYALYLHSGMMSPASTLTWISRKIASLFLVVFYVPASLSKAVHCTILLRVFARPFVCLSRSLYTTIPSHPLSVYLTDWIWRFSLEVHRPFPQFRSPTPFFISSHMKASPAPGRKTGLPNSSGRGRTLQHMLSGLLHHDVILLAWQCPHSFNFLFMLLRCNNWILYHNNFRSSYDIISNAKTFRGA